MSSQAETRGGSLGPPAQTLPCLRVLFLIRGSFIPAAQTLQTSLLGT